MTISKKQSGFAPIVAIVLIGALGIGSVATVTAADKAKPGDILYPLDTSVENIRLAVATSSDSEIEIRTEIASERINEIKQLLQEKGVEATGLDVALNNLTSHKAAVANLVTQKQELKARAKSLEDLFEQEEDELKVSFRTVKLELKQKRVNLKVQLTNAIANGDTAKVESLQTQIAEIEAQLEALEAQQESVEEALEIEEEKLEAQFEAEEEVLEAQEEALEEEEEKLEEELEELEEDNEEERERLEEERDRIREEKEELRENQEQEETDEAEEDEGFELED